MCVAEAATATLDVYNTGGHVIDENTVDEKEVEVERAEKHFVHAWGETGPL